MIKKIIIQACFMAMTCCAFAQLSSTRAGIEQALREKNPAKADSLLQAKLNFLFSTRTFDSLVTYTMYVGKVEQEISNADNAIKKLEAFIKKIESLNPTNKLLANIYNHAAEFYGAVGLNEKAYQVNRKAYQFAVKATDIDNAFIARIESDLGTFAFRKGDLALASSHHHKAIKTFLSLPNPNYESLYVAANNMGGQMWMASKMDSAVYYYNIALDALAKTDSTPINRYYRPATLQNNMAALYNMQGQTQKAIDALKSCIQNLRTYLSIPEAVPKKPNTIIFQFEVTDNLGGIYKELGDYSQAWDLEYYSYQQKLLHVKDDPSGIFKSQILLGSLCYSMAEYDKALDYLNSGLKNITKSDGEYLFWQADACYSLALVYEVKDNTTEAAKYYERADSLYEVSMQGEYDDIYLDFLRNASLFYADNNQLSKALAKANKGFDYVKRTQGSETLLAFYQLLNLAEVHLKAGLYDRSLEFSKKGIEVVDKKIHASIHRLDSVKTELKKPKAVLLKAKSEYHLYGNKDVNRLKNLLGELNAAVNILERRKTFITNQKDIGLLMEDQSGLIAFIKQITMDLYQLTNDQGYINNLMDLQESFIYTRIRSRLDKSDSIKFAHIPVELQEKEKQLKLAVSHALETDREIGSYFKAVEEWNAFQKSLKIQYPLYYRMRYETIYNSLGDIQKNIPANTTLIRYFFIDKDLFAVVLDKQQKKLVALSSTGLEERIKKLTNFSTPPGETMALMHALHASLWSPLHQHIRNSKLVIIPDGILFNLSFEILTPNRIQNFSQLAKESLLANYNISYHYTLALAGQYNKESNHEGNFVAFAPGFMDGEKNKYLSRVTDSFRIDRNYIRLLPQPFTIDLVSRTRQMLGGKAYMNDESTASMFRKFAGSHKIIHIGTHAESNNLSPQYSRLIFAKSGNQESNSIYLYELYNCDLRSELAVLTACESGKPGYQDGEGMISLAHAFNYAGSESMITGLWKIDEKASAIIMDAFYEFLVEGKDKDEALRLAKLEYLKTSNGRMLSPQYWAGLVLMGDTSPIELEKENKSFPAWAWFALTGVVGVIAIAFFLKRKK